MAKTGKIKKLKEILNIALICLIGCVGVVFAVLYLESFEEGFFYNYSILLKAVSISIISILTIVNLVFFKNRTGVLFKLVLILNALIAILLLGIYLLKVSGFLDKIDSIDAFREYIASYGNFAVILFIVLQFAQVVVLPIPAFITIGAGVLLFGPLYGGIYSTIGIISGSLVAFFLGRFFGVKVAKWLVGEESLEKGMKLIKGKDKIILTFMLLFPLFPDDVLCFVAGITTISPIYFTVMIIIVRIITVFASSYSFNNSIIPYDTWWGILIWIAFFIVTLLLTLWVYKNGDKIDKKIKSIFTKKNKEK